MSQGIPNVFLSGCGMIKFIRILLFIPAFLVGMVLSVLVGTIFNLPFILIDHISSNWSLGALLFGPNMNLTEIVCVFWSGFFMASMGILSSVVVFPYERHRNKTAYVLSVFVVLIGLNPANLSSYGSTPLYISKFLGNVTGIIVALIMLRGPIGKRLISSIDKRFPVNS